MTELLSIDLGLRCGIAEFDAGGHVLRYRSTNFGKRSRMKAAAYTLLRDAPDVKAIVAEGDRGYASIFERLAAKRGLDWLWVKPETWREALIAPSERRSGKDAKEAADRLARRVIDESGLSGPTSLRHDAAEAICIGRWACIELGWYEEAGNGQ